MLTRNKTQPGYQVTLAMQTVGANKSQGYETGDTSLTTRGAPWKIDERGLVRQAGKVSIGAEDPDAVAP